ncbi:hypothetical protein PPSIR1_23419 [Plesiocystis pacifica SIR-1]|uniref:Helix-turn-helix domain-containing protein n=1 Tax=Plesiocystis pacifica SIR-1 TaxID=391625 RepID=A6G7S6_9BACT|nr:helix-turn-helix domain-containing protein [Plesiocystis pacifica]EDM78019.1 hypothetical protein PPSIR1_23419 [Plesiocystis pacifica SIR-1]
MNPRSASLPEYLEAEELASLLRVSRKTIYEAVARGEIRARCVSGD